jgi:hypothetical protein
MYRNEFWAIGWETKGITFKAVVFWPETKWFYYLCQNFNIGVSGLRTINWTQRWVYGTKLFINTYSSGFWWIKTDQILFILDNEIEEKRISPVFDIKRNESTENLLFLIKSLRFALALNLLLITFLYVIQIVYYFLSIKKYFSHYLRIDSILIFNFLITNIIFSFNTQKPQIITELFGCVEKI